MSQSVSSLLSSRSFMVSSFIFEAGGYISIVRNIPLPFLLPVFSVLLWREVPAIMSVPKAAVHKDGDLLLWKDKIRMAFDIVMTPPSCVSVFLEQRNQGEFRGFVAGRANLSHYVGSLFDTERIAHGSNIKLDLQAWVGLYSVDDVIVMFNNLRKSCVPPVVHKTAVLHDIRRQELLYIPHFHATGDVCVCQMIHGA